MDTLTHIVEVSFIALVLIAFGAGLTVLNTVAARLSLNRSPSVLHLLPVALPVAGWTGVSLYLVVQIAADPTSANLLPLTIALMLILWLGWIVVTWLLVTLLHYLWRREPR